MGMLNERTAVSHPKHGMEGTVSPLSLQELETVGSAPCKCMAKAQVTAGRMQLHVFTWQP